MAGIGSLPSLADCEVPLLAGNDLTGFSHASNWSQGFLDQRMELADTQKRLPDLSPVHEIHSRKVFFLRRLLCADTLCSNRFGSSRRAGCATAYSLDSTPAAGGAHLVGAEAV